MLIAPSERSMDETSCDAENGPHSARSDLPAQQAAERPRTSAASTLVRVALSLLGKHLAQLDDA